MAQGARKAFHSKVREFGGTRMAAQLLGCSRAYVDMIITGMRRPGLAAAALIEDTMGIPMRGWIDRRAEVSRVRDKHARPARPTARRKA